MAVLQEKGIINEFLNSINTHIPVSAEVVSALPNAFGAICLNQAGVEQFKQSNPINNFLSCFTKKDFVRTMMENEVPQLVGNSVDELMR